MIRRLAAVVGLSMLVPTLAMAQLNTARIDSLVEARRAQHEIPGLAIAIVHPLEVLHERCVGTLRDDTTSLRSTSPLPIPAYSGPITGTLAFRLVDRGTLDLDAPVARYLPSLVVGDSAARSRITPRHLLLHRSGIAASGAEPGSPPPGDLSAVVAGLGGTPLDATPGEGFTYSETNYLVLARLLEVVTGIPYPALVQAELREPLALAAPAEPEMPGTLRFSASDLGRLVRAHLNLGTIGDTTLLTITSVVEMTSFDSGARFAAGWGWRTMPGRNAIGYSGALETSQVEIVMLTSEGIGVVLLANGARPEQWRAMQRLAEDVARLAVGEEPSPSPRAPRGTLVVALSAAVAITAAIVAARRRRQAA